MAVMLIFCSPFLFDFLPGFLPQKSLYMLSQLISSLSHYILLLLLMQWPWQISFCITASDVLKCKWWQLSSGESLSFGCPMSRVADRNAGRAGGTSHQMTLMMILSLLLPLGGLHGNQLIRNRSCWNNLMEKWIRFVIFQLETSH